MSYPQNEQFRENRHEAKMEKKHKLNPAQRAMNKVLGKADKEIKKNSRKEGEAPLEHLKRLTK